MLFLKVVLIISTLFDWSSADYSVECSAEFPWDCDAAGVEEEDLEMVLRKVDRSKVVEVAKTYKDDKTEVPEHFNSLEKWPECKDVIGLIKNQGHCESCWAHCVTQSFSNRLCIAAGGKLQKDFSVHDIVSCCPDCSSNGPSCKHGGKLSEGCSFLISTGVVTTECKPYDVKADFSKCSEKCTNESYEKPYEEDKDRADAVSWAFYVEKKYELRHVQLDIMANGPTCTTIKLSEDFQKSFHDPSIDRKRVYVTPSPNETKWSVVNKSTHAVRVIGWGKQDNVPYWLIANTWGPKWGDNGFFKLRMGTHELMGEKTYFAPLVNKRNITETSGVGVFHHFYYFAFLGSLTVFLI